MCHQLSNRLSYPSCTMFLLDPDSAFSISLKGCEVAPDVNLAQQKYGIKLEVPGPDGMTEYWIRCDSVSAYHYIKTRCFTHGLTFMSFCIMHNMIRININRRINTPNGWLLVNLGLKERLWPIVRTTLK